MQNFATGFSDNATAAIKTIRERLFALKDDKYKLFQCKLMPTVSPDRVIGVRTPEIRSLAKELSVSREAELFLRSLPHKYYEENNLHAFLIEQIKSYDDCIAALDAFMPYVDNWATCDSMKPKIFAKNKSALRVKAAAWMNSSDTYTVRYGIEVLMNYFLDANFDISVLEDVAAVSSDEYYIKMMVAWFFATALAKQYTASITYLKECRLDSDTHNKTIRKAIESRRISEERKKYLRSLTRNT